MTEPPFPLRVALEDAFDATIGFVIDDASEIGRVSGHLPEQFPLRGIAYGQRWVSTPACRAARTASAPLLDAIHYMTLYLITEPLDDTLREFRQLGRDLYDVGRFHLHRRAHLSGPFAL